MSGVKVTYSTQWDSYYVYGPSGGFTKVYDKAYHQSCLDMHRMALSILNGGRPQTTTM